MFPATCFALLPAGARAQTTAWNVASGNWSTAGNWTNGVPGSGKRALINNGGTATLSTAGNLASGLTLGSTGTGGALTIQSGGTLDTSASSEDVIGGGQPGAVTVTGSGSNWTTGETLSVGYGSTGSLTIASGATVTTAIFGTIGYQSVGTGTVTITGSGSVWSTENVFLGDSGAGTLNLAAGGRLTLLGGTGVLDVAYSSGSTGTLNLGTGGSAGVLNAGQVQFRSGTGILNFNHTDSAYVFANSAGTGIAIAGAGAVRQIGSGTTILTGAATHTGGTTVKAGTLEVRGTLAHAGVDLRVGDASGDNGTLRAAQGGDITNANGNLGYSAGSTGTAVVTGAGSTWTNTGSLYAGRGGSGSLTISSGGAVSNVHGFLGFSSGASGSVTVSGAGSTWTNNGDALVGYAGTGNLTVSGGGAAVSTAYTYLGYQSTGVGTATVTGAGSSLTPGSDLVIGNSGAGTLNVAAGGGVTVNGGYIELGRNTGSSGTLNLTGSGSLVSTTGDFVLGYQGTGVLTLSDSGRVRVGGGAGTLEVAGASGSTGTVNIGAVQASAAESPGVFDAGTLQFGSGAGQLQFNHTSGSFVFANQAGAPVVIAGAGSVRQSAGITTLSAANTYTGTTTVAGGTLKISSEQNLGANPASFNAGQLTLGAGTLQTTATFAIDDANRGVLLSGTGTISPDSGTTLTVARVVSGGNLVKAGAGTLALTAANTLAGTTTISAGTLTLGHAQALQSSRLDYTAGSGTLSFGSLTAATLGGLSGDKALALLNASGAPVTLTLAGVAGSVYSGALSGAGSLTTSGGATSLTGAITVTGSLIPGPGTLTIGSTAASFGSLSGSGALALPGGAALTVGGSNEGSLFSGVLSGAGTLVKAGTGTLTLSGASTFAGTVRVQDGFINLGAADTLRYATVEVASAYGLNLFSTNAARIGGLSGAAILEGDAFTLTLTGTGASYSGSLQLDPLDSGTGGLRMIGGTQTFTGAVAAPATRVEGSLYFTGGTHSLGTTQVSLGELRASNSGTVVNSGSVIVGGATTGETSGSNPVLRLSNGGRMNVTGTLAVGQPDDGSTPGLIVESNGALTVSGALSTTASSAVTIQQGALNAASATLAGGAALANGVLSVPGGITLAAGGSISGYGVIVGDVTNTGGTFAIASPTGTVALTAPLTVNSGTARVYSTGTPSFNNSIWVTAGGSIDTPLLNLGASAALHTSGSLTNRIVAAAGSTITATANLTLGNAAAADGFSTAGTLGIGANTVTLASAGVADLGSSTTLGGAAFAGGTLVAPAAGIRIQSGDTVSGYGYIRGTIIDETAGAAFSATGQTYTTAPFAVGADNVGMLASGSFQGGITLAGGTLRPLSPAHGQILTNSISGHGTLMGELQLSTGAATAIALDGNLTIDGTGFPAPQVPRGKTYEVGTHTLTLASGANFQDSGVARFNVNGGRVDIGGSFALPSAGVIELNGAGMLLTSTPNGYRPGFATLTPNATLTLGETLAVGGKLAVFSSNAAVNLGPSTTLAGGMLHSPNGFAIEAGETISGYGLIQGAVSGAGTLSATGGFNGGSTVYGIGGGTTRVLGTGVAEFTFSDAGRTSAATLVAPNGVSLLRDATFGASAQPLAVEGDLTWRGGTGPGGLTVTGNLTGQNLAVTGTTNVSGTFTGSGVFDGSFSAGSVARSGSVTFNGWAQAGATTRLIADGLTTTAGTVTLNGGTFTADHRLRFAENGKLAGAGTFTGYAAGGYGRIENMTGNLTVDARGAGGTVSFERIDTEGDGSFTGTLTIQADAPVTAVDVLIGRGSTFATTNGATMSGHFSVGWGSSAATTVVRGGVTVDGSLFSYSLADYDALAASGGLAWNQMIVRGPATLGRNGGTFDLGGATLGAAQGLVVPAGGTLAMAGARVVGGLQLDGAATGAVSIAGAVTGRGNFWGGVTLLAGAQVLDAGNNLVVDATASSLNPGRVGEAGLLSFGQSLTLAATSALLFELGGVNRETGYDAINVAGTLTLAGTMTVGYVDGFAPQAGHSYNLLDWGGRTGTFSAVNLPVLGSGLVWDTSTFYTNGTLSVGVSAIPEPSTYAALAGVAMLGVAGWRRRLRV